MIRSNYLSSFAIAAAMAAAPAFAQSTSPAVKDLPSARDHAQVSAPASEVSSGNSVDESGAFAGQPTRGVVIDDADLNASAGVERLGAPT